MEANTTMVTPGPIARQHDDPEFEQPDDFATATTRYDAWGWTTIPAGSRLLLVTDGRISAVEMDRALGGEVLHYLTARQLAGPVVALPGRPARWIFLTETADDASPVNFVRIRARGGVVHQSGILLPLPPSRLCNGLVDWHRQPSTDSCSLTPFSAMAGALRSVTETAGCS